MTYQPNRPTLRAYWAHEHDFLVFASVKGRLPFRSELIALHTAFPMMHTFLERGHDPQRAIASQAHLRYLLHDLTSPLEVWPSLCVGLSLEGRRLGARRALTRAERKLRLTLSRIDKGPQR